MTRIEKNKNTEREKAAVSLVCKQKGKIAETRMCTSTSLNHKNKGDASGEKKILFKKLHMPIYRHDFICSTRLRIIQTAGTVPG